MSDDMITQGMLDMFIFETEQGLENLVNICMDSQESGEFSEDNVNEIFRIMHTIKGASAVMMYQNVTTATHKLEDVFYFIRESKPDKVPHSELVDFVLKVSDFVTAELDKIKDGKDADGDETELVEKIDKFLKKIQKAAPKTSKKTKKAAAPAPAAPQHYYIAPVAGSESKFYTIFITYEKDVEMANIRAYMAVNSLKGIAEDIMYTPDDIISNAATSEVILKFGFKIALQTTEKADHIMELVNSSAGIENVEVNEVTSSEYIQACVESQQKIELPSEDETEEAVLSGGKVSPGQIILPGDSIVVDEEEVKKTAVDTTAKRPAAKKAATQSFISVNIRKMDLLMDLIGELVIAQAVVLQNPDLNVPGLDLSHFQKASVQLSKITSELQDAIMAMRMMPLKNTFQKMNRIVYDMSKKLDKDVELEVIGEDTEVDKNIIEHISDPLMHLIRNSVDHGIETRDERAQTIKSSKAKVTLEAKNQGGQVWISVSDDGKGLDRDAILKKAEDNGLLGRKSKKDLTDKEVYNFITLPGFSTQKSVTEFSGRGVGMDVVVKNIQTIGGMLEIDSKQGFGSSMTMKIPLTLAIIDGMVFKIADTCFVAPTSAVTEFVRLENESVIVEPDGEEYVTLRNESYPFIRLGKFYHINEAVNNPEEGVIIILNHEERKIAVLVDKLIGEQEIVVKPLPSYIKKVHGISGCTELGDGSISLIIDTAGLITET